MILWNILAIGNKCIQYLHCLLKPSPIHPRLEPFYLEKPNASGLWKIYKCKHQDVYATSQKGHISFSLEDFHGAVCFAGYIFVLLLWQNTLAHFGANCKTGLIAVHITYYYH